MKVTLKGFVRTERILLLVIVFKSYKFLKKVLAWLKIPEKA